MMDVRELQSHIEHELIQLDEEGYDIANLKQRFDELTAEGRTVTREELESLIADLESCHQRPDFPYHEPSELEAILSARPAERPTISFRLTEAQLRDRIMGAWFGRVIGCMVGKPVEGWSKERIERYLQSANAYPLTNYFPPLATDDPGLQIRNRKLLLGGIECALRDDDIDYTILNQHVVQVHGWEFDSDDVASEWLMHLPYHCVYTAERVAYRNLVMGLRPPTTATHRNPFREWIGAQIRADAFGFINPGNPERAARMAFCDAALSHTKNGIYGEMWVAATIAAALVTEDVKYALRIGLAQIPEASRLAEALRDALNWHSQCSTWEDAWRRAERKYGHYHPVHTINNAVVTALGLLYGNGDFRRTVGYAVMGGWDCDCNGATAGAIIGAIVGLSGIPSDMLVPLHDTYYSGLAQFAQLSISGLASESFNLAVTKGLA